MHLALALLAQEVDRDGNLGFLLDFPPLLHALGVARLSNLKSLGLSLTLQNIMVLVLVGLASDCLVRFLECRRSLKLAQKSAQSAVESDEKNSSEESSTKIEGDATEASEKEGDDSSAGGSDEQTSSEESSAKIEGDATKASEKEDDDSSSESDSDEDEDDSDSDSEDDDDDEDSNSDKSKKKKSKKDDKSEKDAKSKKEETWTEYYNRFKPLLKCLVPPKDNRKIQLCYLISVMCLFVGRYLNFLLPTIGASITDQVFAGGFPYMEVIAYWALSLTRGSLIMGLIEGLVEGEVDGFSYKRLVQRNYAHVMQLDQNFHTGNGSGGVKSDMEASFGLSGVWNDVIVYLVPGLVDGVMAFVVLCNRFNSSVALLMAMTSCAYVCLRMYTAGLYVASRRKARKAEKKQEKIMDESLRGWTSLASFNMFSYWETRFQKSVEKHMVKNRAYRVLYAYLSAASSLLLPTCYLALNLLILAKIQAGQATPGDFVFFVQYWGRICGPMANITHIYRYVLDQFTGSEKSCDLLAKEAKVKDKEGALSLSNVQGHVELDNAALSFGEKKALNGVTLSVSAGETIGVVGKTGSGKSSLMNMIRRVYDVDSGSITIDGKDVRDVTQSSIRENISVVPQQPFFFNTTIMNNLRYARPSATDEEIHEVCRAACIHDQIMKFPKGYKSIVGDNGIKLSGGEQQRIAIASALLKKAPIMIMDEATSAVDTETELHIQSALKNIHGRQTTFVVAHRLSTITKADQIIVLEEGKISERGTHKELRDNGGLYSRLWKAMVQVMNDDE